MPRPRKSSYGDEKPPFSYVALCAMALHGSATGMMTLNDIYRFITNNFPFYKTHPSKWRNSLRHNLSFNDCFVKIVCGTTTGAKRSYWSLHPSCGDMFQDGSLLRRKKRFVRSNGYTVAAESSCDSEEQDKLSAVEGGAHDSNCLYETSECDRFLSQKSTRANVTTDFTIDSILGSTTKAKEEDRQLLNKISRHHSGAEERKQHDLVSKPLAAFCQPSHYEPSSELCRSAYKLREPSSTAFKPRSFELHGPSLTLCDASPEICGPSSQLPGPSLTLCGPPSELCGPSLTLCEPSPEKCGPSSDVHGTFSDHCASSSKLCGPSSGHRRQSSKLCVPSPHLYEPSPKFQEPSPRDFYEPAEQRLIDCTQPLRCQYGKAFPVRPISSWLCFETMPYRCSPKHCNDYPALLARNKLIHNCVCPDITSPAS